MSNWPKHYPAACPPTFAAPTDGVIYRFTSRQTPHDRDFKSYYDAKPENDWGSAACQARGLSVYPSLKACAEVVSLIPALAKKSIAVGILDASAGVIAPTPSQTSEEHHTWWIDSDFTDPCGKFINVEKTGGVGV